MDWKFQNKAKLFVWFQLFATDSDLKHSQSYRIMFHLGIADMNQLSMQIMAGLFSIYNITANVWINKVWAETRKWPCGSRQANFR